MQVGQSQLHIRHARRKIILKLRWSLKITAEIRQQLIYLPNCQERHLRRYYMTEKLNWTVFYSSYENHDLDPHVPIFG